MARKEPSSPGGKILAIELTEVITANVREMNNKSGKRDADLNAAIGNEDLANVIAIAIEKVMNNLVTIGPPNESTLVAGTAPVLGATKLSFGAPYVFK